MNNSFVPSKWVQKRSSHKLICWLTLCYWNLCNIFSLHIFFVNTFFSTWISGLRKKIMQTAKKIQQNLSFVFDIFLTLYFLCIFSLLYFFYVVHNFCVGITISIYFCINLILKVKLWCWMLLLLMSLHWLPFKTVSRNFFIQWAGMRWSYSWLMGCELYWYELYSCWYEVKIDK